MSTQTTNNATQKKEFTLKPVFVLWKKKSKDGKKSYFTGSCDDRECYLTAFYNTQKQNPKEPDIRVYERDKDGNLSKDVFVSLWCNVTKNGKKILSGKIDGKRVIGFINQNAKEKQPYVSVYWSDDEKQEKKEEKYVEIKQEDIDLPF